MAIEDGHKDYVSSLGLDSGEVKQNRDAPSAEDVAWADSCLAVNSLSESGWESLREALLDALDSQPDSLKHEKHDFHSESDTETNKLSKQIENAVNFSDGADTEMTKSSELTENAVNFSVGADTEMISASKETEVSVNLDRPPDNDTSFINDSDLGTENGDTLSPGFNLDNVFLPTYNESNRNIGLSDPEYESAFPAAFVIDDQSPEDIFKVWELGSSGEDEEFINQLNKALSEKPPEPLSALAVPDVSGSPDDLGELDDLISGIGDLFLVERL